MIAAVVASSVIAGLFLLGFLLFLYWALVHFMAYKHEVDKAYSLAEVGYIRKAVASDIDMDKLNEMFMVEHNSNFRKKLSEKIIKEYIEGKE